jgi:hypothetical protein
MPAEVQGKTDVKDLFKVVTKSPAIMIVLGVGIVVVIYLAWKNNQNNAAATTATLPSSQDSSTLAGSQLPGSYYLPQSDYVQTPQITLNPTTLAVVPTASATSTFTSSGGATIPSTETSTSTASVGTPVITGSPITIGGATIPSTASADAGSTAAAIANSLTGTASANTTAGASTMIQPVPGQLVPAPIAPLPTTVPVGNATATSAATSNATTPSAEASASSTASAGIATIPSTVGTAVTPPPAAAAYFGSNIQVIQNSYKNSKTSTWNAYNSTTKKSTNIATLFPKGTSFSANDKGQAFYVLPGTTTQLALSTQGLYGHQYH